MDLRNNNLEAIPFGLLMKLDNLQYLHVEGNPFSESFIKKFKAMSRLLPHLVYVDRADLDYFHERLG